MNTPKISVIVPVYNVEQYLPRCIDSILAQTFTDFELLLIDDGSPDKSGEICDEYAERDSRIRVFHKKNGGVSSARNKGLELAWGNWIAFVDSDDIVLKTYLEDMYKYANQDNLIILTNYKKEGKDHIINLPQSLSCNDEMVKFILKNDILSLSAPYSKLYNRKIILDNYIHFPIGIHMGEDGIFNIRYLNCINAIITINKTNYIVNNTEDSLSSNYYSFESEWLCFTIWRNEINKFIYKYGIIFNNPQEVLWENRICETFNRCLQCLNRQKKNITIKEQLKILKNIPSEDYKCFCNYYKPSKIRRKLLKYLICQKLFLLYVLIGKIERYLKK